MRELFNLAEKYLALDGAAFIPFPKRPAMSGSRAFSGGSPLAGNACAGDLDAPETLEAVIIRHVPQTLSCEEGNIARKAARLGVDGNRVKRWRAKS